MRWIAILLLLAVGCSTADPAQQTVDACDDQVPVFVGTATDEGIVVTSDDPSERTHSFESAGCVLAKVGAPREVGRDIDSTGNGQVRRASWDGWDAVWSVDDTYGVTLTVTPR